MNKEVSPKISQYLNDFGVSALNLVVERHHMSEEKRTLFAVRFASQDEQEQIELTKEMDLLTNKIKEIDTRLESFGVTDKIRPQIIKELKKWSPDGWFSGFVEF